MARFYILYLLLIATTSTALSQSINVSEVNASNYPEVSAYFSAFDNFGNYFTDISSDQMQVIENGYLIPAELIEINCTSNLPVNVVLALDRSSSMNEEYDGEALWDWVVAGATEFIESFNYGDSSKIAIISFSGNTKLVCNFSNDKQELLDSLRRIPDAYGATNFNDPFFNATHGIFELLKTRPGHHRRSVVFLSDGNHESGVVLQRSDISKTLNEMNIRFYGISLMVDSSPDLARWAKETAGKNSFIYSKSELSHIYRTFAADLVMTVVCELKWLSPDICDISEINKNVQITFIPYLLSADRSYQAPESSIVHVDTDLAVYDFGDPDLGSNSTREITITPRLKPIMINDMFIHPMEFFEIIDWGDNTGIKPSFPMVIGSNNELKLKVRYKPEIIRKYRQATLTIDGTPCPIEIPLVGGFQQVKIDSPSEGEFLSRCDTVEIKWSGVPADVIVDIHYTTNGGSSWQLVASKVSGNKYNWFPGFSSDKFQLKIEVSNQFDYDFIRSYGGTGNEFATSLDLQENGLYHTVCGYFGESLNIAGKQHSSNGKNDLFVAKFDLDGNPIWVNTAGSESGNDEAYGVDFDRRNNVYITGVAYQGIKYGAIRPQLELPNMKYLFISKYSSSGQYVNSAFLGPSSYYDTFEAEGIKIRTSSEEGKANSIIVIGKYHGFFTRIDLGVTLPAKEKTKPGYFTAVYDEYLNLIELYPSIIDNEGFSDTTSMNSVSLTRYSTGSFGGSQKIHGLNLTSAGQSDFWISKFAKNPVSFDSTGLFTVKRPVLSSKSDTYDFGDVVFGEEVEQNAEKFLFNNNELPFTITAYTILDVAGKPMTDFELRNEIIGLVLMPGDSVSLDLWFKPAYLSHRTATLSIKGICASDLQITLKGNGVCGGEALEIHDFGDVSLNKQVFDTLVCVFRNISETAITISPQIRGKNYTEFLRILPDWVKAKEFNGRITVAPYECIDIIIAFEPKEMGLREAELNFFVQSPCKNSITKLIGNGVTADVGITSYDWGAKRVNGVYSSSIEIINNSNSIATIENLQFESANNNGIFKYTAPQTPFNIEANGKLLIPVEFNPADEISYDEEILVFVSNRETPLISNLTGSGFLPKLIVSWDCGEHVSVGETALGSLTLQNPSKSAALNVKSVELEYDDEFEFAPGHITEDFIIDVESEISIPVLFKPISDGDYSDTFIIFADDYDGLFPDEWKKTEEIIICDGLDADVTNPVDFGTLIVCSDKKIPISISNKSKETDIQVFLSQMEITGNGTEHFSLPQLNDRIIKGGETYSFELIFNPTIIGEFDVQVRIPNSMGADFIVESRGNSKGLELTSDKTEITMETGDKVLIPLIAKLPATHTGFINSLKLIFTMDADVAGIVPNSVSAGSAIADDFTWGEVISLGAGKFEINGNGTIADNQELVIMNFELMSYLNDKHSTTLNVKIDYGCLVEEFELTVINTEEVCFNDNRIILLNSNSKFSMNNPVPNPATESFKLDYGIGFDVLSKIEVLNYYGESVMTVYDGMLQAGTYSEVITTTGLSSGTYMIRISAGPFTDTKQFLIVK